MTQLLTQPDAVAASWPHLLGPAHRLPLINALQAYLLFRAALAEPFTFSSGPESLEVKLVAPEDIEWNEVRSVLIAPSSLRKLA